MAASRRRRPINGTSTASPTAEGNHQPAPAPDLQHPEVVIETTLGKMTVQLDAKNAPLTVENFLRYVNAGEYDQTIVHQVYKGQVFLAGGYGKDFVEKPARTAILSEADNGLKNLRGTIAMARLADGFHTATRRVLRQRGRQSQSGLQGPHARRIRLLRFWQGDRRHGRGGPDRQCQSPRRAQTSTAHPTCPSSSPRSGKSIDGWRKGTGRTFCLSAYWQRWRPPNRRGKSPAREPCGQNRPWAARSSNGRPLR